MGFPLICRATNTSSAPISCAARTKCSPPAALLVVREHIHHGEWNEFLDRLSIDRTLAKRMQQQRSSFQMVRRRTICSATGNKSKLIELLVLDDDQVAELNEGGTVAGITLDDVATMSVSDLRKTLREARAEAEANDKLLSEKNDQIDTLKKSVTLPTPDQG